MCDYSLAGIRNRLAVEGEELIVYRFCTGSRGLASPADLPMDRERRSGWWIFGDVWSSRGIRFRESPPAVCVAPGTRLLVRDIPEHLQENLGVGEVEEVTFTQLTAEAFRFRDAVRFKNGKQLLLQQLSDGQRVRVLNLSTEETTPDPDVHVYESAFRID